MSKSAREYYDFMPAAVASMQRPPNVLARVVSWTIFAFVLVLLAWLYYAKVDVVISAQGKIIPSGKVKLIQSPELGIVRHIFVADGQLVERGAPLLELDQTDSDADETQIEQKLFKSQIIVNRIQAELAGVLELEQGAASDSQYDTEHRLLEQRFSAHARSRERLVQDRDELKAALQGYQHESEKQRAELTYTQHVLLKKKDQAERGLIPYQEVEDIEFEVKSQKIQILRADSKIEEAKIKIASAASKMEGMDAEHQRDLLKELSDAQGEFESIQQDLIKAQSRMANQVLRAPVSGIVQQLALNTIGGVVSAAEKLMVIVPADVELEMEASILNRDVGFVGLDNPTRVKVNAYEYTRYGSLQGHITWVASDAVIDEKLGPIYPVKIALASVVLPRRVNNRVAQVLSGMNATADIVIGERRLIEYFLGTILRYQDESLNER